MKYIFKFNEHSENGYKLNSINYIQLCKKLNETYGCMGFSFKIGQKFTTYTGNGMRSTSISESGEQVEEEVNTQNVIIIDMNINKSNTIPDALLYGHGGMNKDYKYYFFNDDKRAYNEELITTTSEARYNSNDLEIQGTDINSIVKQIGNSFENLIIKSDDLILVYEKNVAGIHINIGKGTSKDLRFFKNVFLHMLRNKKDGNEYIDLNKSEIDYLSDRILNHPYATDLTGMLKSNFIKVYNKK